MVLEAGKDGRGEHGGALGDGVGGGRVGVCDDRGPDRECEHGGGGRGGGRGKVSDVFEL